MDQNGVRKDMKNEVKKYADLGPQGPGGGGTDPGSSGEYPCACGKTHMFVKSGHITWEGHTNGPY